MIGGQTVRRRRSSGRQRRPAIAERLATQSDASVVFPVPGGAQMSVIVRSHAESSCVVSRARRKARDGSVGAVEVQMTSVIADISIDRGVWTGKIAVIEFTSIQHPDG